VKLKYAAIDIETTGLDPGRHHILAIGCVVETDWETPVEKLPTFHCYFEENDPEGGYDISGHPVALAMNARIIAQLALTPGQRDAMTLDPDGDGAPFYEFLAKHLGGLTHVVAGKNFGTFDLQFLRACPFWNGEQFNHRIIDPGTLYLNPETDHRPPSTAECCKRAGVTNLQEHHPVEDCRTVVRLIRARFAKS
jgi:DNA polymerase III epsilon subunit-like protein